jgi:hypothetical protein
MRSLASTIGVCALVAAMTATPAGAAGHVIEVIDFDATARTAQGGLFGCFGALPNHLRDRMVTAGSPACGAWRLEVVADAPSAGLGGAIPLFNRDLLLGRATRTPDNPPKLLDISSAPNLQLRLIGALGERKLQVALVPKAEPGSAGIRVGTLAAGDLDARKWSTKSWSVAESGVDLTSVGFIQLTLEGTGPGWIAVDAARFSAAESTADWRLTPPADAPSIRQAMWVWKTREILPDPAQVERLLAFCETHRITDLFWQVRKQRSSGDAVVLEMVDAQRAFNTAAHRAGIRVHALDGDPQFVLRKKHARVFNLVDALVRFNQEGPADARFDAVHMDNEPYVLKEWKQSPADRQEIIQSYIELNRELQRRVHAGGMQYGVDIPFWWDKVDAAGVRAYQVKTEQGDVPLLEAIFGLVDNAGIMSYRVRVTGPNGVIDCCQTEFALGAQDGTEVFASVELGVGPKVEAGITFGVYPMAYFWTQLETLGRMLPAQRGCVGVAIHAYQFFEESSLENKS